MKKSLFILATAAIALASCSNDKTVEVNQTLGNEPQEIAFFPLSQKSARLQAPARAAVQGTGFPNQSMEVVAYQTDPSAVNYFTKTTFAQDGSTGIWKGTTAKYWPLSAAKLNFFAVSGADVNAADITIDNALLKTDVADVKYTKAGATGSYTNATQSDIMYAFGRGYVEQSGNALHFNSGTSTDAPVDMVFKHTMSLIKFQVKAANTASCAIQINSIKLNGASYTGALKLTADDAITANTGAPTITVAWTPDATEDNVTVPNINN